MGRVRDIATLLKREKLKVKIWDMAENYINSLFEIEHNKFQF